MLRHRDTEKSHRYLDLLDAALCNAQWQEVPGLARKVGKHAPQRKCLVAAANVEAEVALEIARRHTSSQNVSNTLSHLVPGLENAIAEEKINLEDAFQARTCLGWLLWTIGNRSVAAQTLSTGLPEMIDLSTEKQSTSRGWTFVCLSKSAYLQGAAEEAPHSRSEVLEHYERTIARAFEAPLATRTTSEYRVWTERLVTSACMLSSRLDRTKDSTTDHRSQLAPFRAWARFWENASSQGHSMTTGSSSETARRRRVWLTYYDMLSRNLHHVSTTATSSGRQHSIEDDSTDSKESPIAQRAAEIARVEAIYEDMLLKQVAFPMANEANPEIDHWVNQVMSNWRLICASTLQDNNTGQLGQEDVSRNVLGILYRAATRSFNSTPILRYLFTVHASLAEFELASKALDSYLEIISKGKARVDKSGEPEPGLDSDALMLQTIAAGISMLCEFGRRKEAERAHELATHLEKWLNSHRTPIQPDYQSIEDHTASPSNRESTTGLPVPDSILAIAYQAIGTSQAHWARLTYQTSNRAELQIAAISNFRRALEHYSADDVNTDILYALALVLAETRDTDGAIACIKLALSDPAQSSPVTNGMGSHGLTHRGNEIPNRRNLKCWHLLALLLSARQDFDKADATLEALLGDVTVSGNGARNHHASGTRPMDFFEKQNMIETRITQMALAEINDGPEVAVNRGGELLSVYASFFQDAKPLSNEKPTQHSSPPPTSNGTHRSFRESMFGRSNHTRTSVRASTAPGSVRSQRDSSEIPEGPTISVMHSGNVQPAGSTHLLHRKSSKRLQKSPSKKSISRSRASSPARTLTTGHESAPSAIMANNNQGGSVTSGSESHRPATESTYAAGEVGLAVSHDLPTIPASPEPIPNGEFFSQAEPIASVAQTLNNSYDGTAFEEQKYHQYDSEQYNSEVSSDVFDSLPIHFSPIDQQRQSRCLLIRVWLVIAGVYRRAGMYDDAQGALDEAIKQVKHVEAMIASQNSSAHAFEDPGWGGMKSIEELWADVYHERGNLYIARSAPHDAILQYESALSHYPDHPGATVGLSNILLDIYSQLIPLHREKHSLQFEPLDSVTSLVHQRSKPTLATIALPPTTNDSSPQAHSLSHFESPLSKELSHSSSSYDPASSNRKSPEAIDRLAARDRAYGLLSSLTKLGTGWDNSEAWFALARAYEESGQIERSKEVLWWVVELEEKRPIRPWSCLGQGYSL